MAVATQTTAFFLSWLAGRLVGHYGESPNTDFVLRLNEEAARAQTLRSNLAMNENTYQLVKTTVPPDMDGRSVYALSRRGKPGRLGSKLRLTEQEAEDISRQLDAPVDYFND
jgi:hypothetical protein